MYPPPSSHASSTRTSSDEKNSLTLHKEAAHSRNSSSSMSSQPQPQPQQTYDHDALARHFASKAASRQRHETASSSAASSLSSVATYATTVDSKDSASGGYGGEKATESSLPPMAQPWNPTTCSTGEQQRRPPTCTIGEVLSDPLPATSQDFAALFPSERKLIIHHDHSYTDGSMNLRADVLVRTPAGETCPMTLYHLRMRDLRTRVCSLRRYERDSGREVCCASAAVKKKPGAIREARKIAREEGWRGSFGSLLGGFGRSKRGKVGDDGRGSVEFGDSRRDSGYGSIDEEEVEDVSHGSATTPTPVMKDQINLEFSNYARVDIKRKGVGQRSKHKHYDFEYWGVNYSWNRAKAADNSDAVMNYQLISHATNQVVAQIAAIPLTKADAYDEVEKGSWVPPCSLWICDGNIVKGRRGDVADVIVSTGMMCLVDGWVRKRFEV